MRGNVQFEMKIDLWLRGKHAISIWVSFRDVPVTNEGIREVSFRDQGVRVVLH